MCLVFSRLYVTSQSAFDFPVIVWLPSLYQPLPLSDLPEQLALNVDQGSWRGAPHREDIVCLVKRHICDTQLSQKPLLVLPESRVARVGLNTEVKPLVCFNICVW